MSDEIQEVSTEVQQSDGGKIIFADDVVATIAALATAEVAGVAGMSGGVVEGFTEMLGRKNLTKGVKVEVGQEEAAVDISVLIQYGFRIQEVCKSIQTSVKNAIETMTGLRVVEVNVFVQAINFETPESKAEKKAAREAAKEKERIEKEIAKEKERQEKEAAKAAKEAEKEAAKAAKEAEKEASEPVVCDTQPEPEAEPAPEEAPVNE